MNRVRAGGRVTGRVATQRVLIVDDEAEVRRALRDIPRAMRYAETLEVIEAADGQEGLDAVVRRRPALVLLDLQMPRVGGLARLKQLRDLEPRLPIIVITGTQETKLSAEAAPRRGRVPAQAVRVASRRDARRDLSRLEPAWSRQAGLRRALSAPGAHVLRAAWISFRIDDRRTFVMSARERTRSLERANPG